MGVQLICNLDNGSKITFELLDNPFMTEWIEQHRIVNQTFNFNQTSYEIPFVRHEFDEEKVSANVELLKRAITQLNDMELHFPIEPENLVLRNNKFSRQLLNQLHRFFTTSHRSVASLERNFTWKDKSNYTFNLERKNYRDFAELVHQINTLVHDTENYYTNDRIKNFPPKKEWLVLYNSNDYKTDVINVQYYKNIIPKHYIYFSDDFSHDLWLPLTQIQGKNYVNAYFDEDEPTNWDVSNNIIYSGSFSIGDRSWTREPVIEEWLSSYGIKIGPLAVGMPLGKCVEGKEFIDSLGEIKILSVELKD